MENRTRVELQEHLFEILIGLVRASEGHMATASTDQAVIEAVVTSIGDSGVDEQAVKAMIDQVALEKFKVSPGCSGCASPCGRTNDYNMQIMKDASEDIRSLKSLMMYGARWIAVRVKAALELGYTDEAVTKFLYRVLFIIGENWDQEDLVEVLEEIAQHMPEAETLREKAGAAEVEIPLITYMEAPVLPMFMTEHVKEILEAHDNLLKIEIL